MDQAQKATSASCSFRTSATAAIRDLRLRGRPVPRHAGDHLHWNENSTGHDGLFPITRSEVLNYYETYKPIVLRYDRNTDSLGLPAKNFGIAKGSTYDRVLIFPTQSWRRYFKDGDQTRVTSREKFYVALTRARFSVAYVTD